MQRRAVAIVDAEPIKRCCERGDVRSHVGPEPWVGRGPLTVAQLDAVAPDDDFAAKVRFRREKGKILQRVCGPNPTVVGEGIFERIRVGFGREAREVWFDNRGSTNPLARRYTTLE